MAKTISPLSKIQFLEKAQPLRIDVAGTPMAAVVKEFSTGSFGWYTSGKVTVEVDGKPLQMQVGCNLTVVGSKEAPR